MDNITNVDITNEEVILQPQTTAMELAATTMPPGAMEWIEPFIPGNIGPFNTGEEEEDIQRPTTPDYLPDDWVNGRGNRGGHLRPLISHEDEEYEGGKKSNKIKDIINIFKQYPDIFPSGYFRFLPATLEKHDKKGTLIYKNGVVLTYTKYKKTVNKYKKYIIKPGDVKLNQLVNKNQGNGKAKKIFLKFMKTHKDSNLLLDVLASNKRAIKFYRKNGFKKIADTKFGDKLKGIVMLKKSKKNKTRKRKN